MAAATNTLNGNVRSSKHTYTYTLTNSFNMFVYQRGLVERSTIIIIEISLTISDNFICGGILNEEFTYTHLLKIILEKLLMDICNIKKITILQIYLT